MARVPIIIDSHRGKALECMASGQGGMASMARRKKVGEVNSRSGQNGVKLRV